MHEDATWYRVRPRPRPHCARWQPSSPPHKKRWHSPQLAQLSAHIYCGQTAGWIKMPLGTEVRLGSGEIVLYGDPTSPIKGAPQFSACVYCGQTAVCIRIPLGTQVGLSLGDRCVRRGPSSTPLKRHSPQFSAHVRCGQTAGLTKMLLGPSSPPQKEHSPTQISAHVYCSQTAEWMKTPLDTEVDLGPGHVVLDGDPGIAVPVFLGGELDPYLTQCGVGRGIPP